MSPRRRLGLRTWLLLSYLAVFSLPWLAMIGSGALAHDLRRQTLEHLVAQGELWRLRLAHTMTQQDVSLAEAAAAVREDLLAARDRTLCATQIVDAQGLVLASTGAATGHNLAGDPEVARALAGDLATAQRERSRVSPRGDAELDGPSRFAPIRLFVALPIVHGDAVVGAVVMSRTPREELQAFVHMGPRLLLAVAVGIALTLALSLTSGHLGSRSLAALAAAARRIAAGARDGDALVRLERSRVREVGSLADAVRAMHEQLQSRLDYIDEFAGNVAHEFRTPISTLRGTVELLHDEPDMDAGQRERFLVNAQAELRRLESLIDGLLALARAERPTARGEVDLGALVRRVAARRDRPVTVTGEGAIVLGAEGQLESVLDNLLDNAVRHGGDDVHLTVELHREDALAGFTVVDDGRGIPAADLPKVFERFFTTARSGGTGLGLALVAAIVRAHGGSVGATSESGRTAFVVRLPRA
ncbi:MAG: HAMP domain-containing histidine kinase [Nannocystaceae bacterium]|nr:HAMP domain-containing histidine kinase [Nannocystaceae bacterium]